MTDSESAALARAHALMELRRYAEAERTLRAHLAGHPESVGCLTVLAWALSGLDRHAEAVDAARRALSLAPQDLDALVALAVLSSGAGDPEGGVRAGVAAVREDPDAWQAQYALARALLGLRRPRVRDALFHVHEALRLAPHDPDLHHLRGVCLENLTLTVDAREAYHDALRIDPEHAHAMASLASLDLDEHRLRRATRGLAQALRIVPDDGHVHAHLATLTSGLMVRLSVLLGAAAVVMSVLVLAEPSWVARAAVGTGLLATCVAVVVALGRHLPRALRRPTPSLLRALPRVQLAQLALMLLVVVAILGMAYGSPGVADGAARGLLMLLLVALGLTVVGSLVWGIVGKD